MNRALIGMAAVLVVINAIPADAAKKWRAKEACTLIENEANDGDSFHVKVNRRHYIFRLLWVDTPETEQRFPERVAEQAAYFGIAPADAIIIGKQAVAFSTAFLARAPFTVFTQFDDAMGSSEKDRDYAVIKAGDTYLMEALVSNGLARIHGLQEMPDDGPTVDNMRRRLKALEKEAREAKRGAWALAVPAASPFGPALIPGERKTAPRSVQVLAPDDPGRLLGTLTAGTAYTVVESASPVLVRIRIETSDGRAIEGLCRRSDLGL